MAAVENVDAHFLHGGSHPSVVSRYCE